MNFWIFAITLLIVSAAIVGWPLFTGSVKDKITGLFILLMLPLAGLLMYQSIGTPEAINLPPAMAAQQSAQQQSAHSTQQGQMDELVASLQQRMIENPDDSEGWIILGRSLKTMQRYAEAETALRNANRLVPDNPSMMVELAETMLFTSGQSEVTGEARELIEAALAIDPDQQKGLWIMGMAYAQEVDDTQALAHWQRLLGQLDPASEPYQSVSQQIRLAQTRLGQPEATQDAVAETVAEAPRAAMLPVAAPVTTKPAATPTAAAGFGIPTTITLGEGVTESFPAKATLFIFIHPAGGAGMPLAVKRLAPQDFPMSLNFTDADLLQPGGSLQAFDLLDISARISMAGVANVASGDIQANRVTVNTKNVSAIALHLDQRVP
jgi:cytochrome c-type biogenesis protein CcmH